MLIYMFLQPGTVEEELYSGQAVVQVILLLLAVANVPILLLLKPLWLRYQHNKTAKQGYRGIGDTSRITHALDDDDDESNPDAHTNGRDSTGDDEGAMITENIGGDDEEHEEFEFSEVMIHQVSLATALLEEQCAYANGEIRPSTRSSSVSIASLTQHHTSVFGLCRLLISSSRSSCGT
jgi:hypothetical protein